MTKIISVAVLAYPQILILKGNISMNIYYLYVKTHNITGLKYLGFTKSKDPYKYLGSGTRWLNHLKIHGNDISTRILKESNNLLDIKQLGKFYSDMWSVVESKEWANLKPETGEGGWAKPSIENLNKRMKTRIERNKVNTNSVESIAKSLETKKKNGTLSQSKETREKALLTKYANGLYQNPQFIQKILETKKKNGTLNCRNSENIRKQKETIAKQNNNNCKVNNPTFQKKRCQYCNNAFGLGMYSRWHGENCKFKCDPINS